MNNNVAPCAACTGTDPYPPPLPNAKNK